MRYWETKDEPTNVNLRYLESLARPWSDMTVDQFMDRIRGVIGVEEMLPKAVRDHFKLPYLFVGNDPYSWSKQRLDEKNEELCTAISEGLERVYADDGLKKGGAASFDDRPVTKGEEVRAAVEAFSRTRGQSELSTLRMAISGTHLRWKMDRLEKWLNRKRPSPGGQPVEYEIVSAIADIRRYADELHCEKASYGFGHPFP